jgi:predicted RecB family nuclease
MRLDARSAINCHEFLHKKFAPNAFPGLQPDPPDPVFQEFQSLGFSQEEKVILSLSKLYPDMVQINQEQNNDEIERETVKALLDPNAFIVSGVLIKEIAEQQLAHAFGRDFTPTERASRPDLMIRIGGSKDGVPHWAPIDIKSHKADEDSKSNILYLSSTASILPSNGTVQEGRLDYNDLHQLAHYTRHFQSIGIAGDELWVGIIGREIAICSWARLGDVVIGRGKSQQSFFDIHDEKFAKAREAVRLSLIENENPSEKAGIIPVNSSGKMGCTVCQYKLTCFQEMISFDQGHGHVTLLAGVTPLIVEKNFPDVQSINDLVEITPQNDAMVIAQIRARVWQTGIPELLEPAEQLLIPEADIEIDIDLENSMEVLRELEIDEPLGEDRLYLYGFGIHDRTVDSDWRSAVIDTYSDYSNTEEGEFLVFSSMWNRLHEEITRAKLSGRTIKIFHYSPHEYSWWKKFATRFEGKDGVPTLDELESFKFNYLVDLYPIAQKIAFQSKSYSIKDLAKLAGFEWSVEMAGGANSLFKYRDAINKDFEQSVRDSAIAWLDAYNRDDVRATLAFRSYLRTLLRAQ